MARSRRSRRKADARQPVVKAHFVGRDGSESSNVLETDEETRRLFENKGAIEPPLDLVTLAHLFEMSGALRSNVDAYATNIDGFGHTFEPTINLDDDDVTEKIKQAMIEERLLTQKAAASDGDDGVPTGSRDAESVDITEPSQAEVQARLNIIAREMVRERMRLDRFFEFCCVDDSFTDLRMKLRQDLEVLGNGYWEVLRNKAGDIVQLTHVPAFTVRLMPQDRDVTSVDMPVQSTAITEDVEVVYKRFRSFLQVINAQHRRTVYFKEFGDPRVRSATTGEVYATENAMQVAEPGARKATELLHFKVHNSRTPYGIPRWVSEMLAVLGNRHADEINLAYFENRAVPPMFFVVSGGRIAAETVTKFENYFKNELRGKRHHHNVGIIEAETAGIAGGISNGNVKVDVIKLRDVQQDDALFMNYKEQNTDNLGNVFRMPRLLRGDVRDFNRATAQTALEFAEQQVFGPLRQQFDWVINRRVLTDFGVRFWRFRSNGPDFTDPNDLLQRVSEAGQAAYVTPNELRELASKGFKHALAPIDAAWARERPMQMTLAAIARKTNLVDAAGEEVEEAPPPDDADDSVVDDDAAPDEDADEIVPGKKAPVEQTLRLPTPHEMAAQAVSIMALRDYVSVRQWVESRDSENVQD